MNAPTDRKTRTAVSVSGLRKTYGANVVLDGVDLTIAEGEVCALLGPNGAGKTTMVRILSTLIAADAGTATVNGGPGPPNCSSASTWSKPQSKLRPPTPAA